MKRNLPLLLIGAILALFLINPFDNQDFSDDYELTSEQAWDKQIAKKRAEKKAGWHKYDRPDEFALFQKGIRTREGESNPGYPANYVLKELQKAQTRQKSFVRSAKTSAANAITWTERGPANVPGRTRAIVVMPQDATHNTWVIGSVGGGIWKTTDGGSTWVEKTKDLPNIAFTTIALAESSPAILYAGTGEAGLGGVGSITGNGIFKSTDSGETWTQLASTADNSDFQNINRLIVDPSDENVLIICTTNNVDYESGIYKSIDGGVNWTNAALSSNTRRGFQHIVATPENFNIQYASFNGVGVYKSINAGDTWTLSNTGMSPDGRVEIAVSPVNPDRIFASAEGSSTGSGSDLYISNDAGAGWSLVDVSHNGNSANYLRDQGWFDNIVLCSPYDEDVVYVGGVSILKVTLGTGGSSTATIYNVEQNGTTGFLDFVSFNSATAFNNRLVVGADANGTSVEFRFGPGLSQKAHRFTVPSGLGSGVPDNDYSYQDYVDVPFEVWDTDLNRQLMVSFRDQQVDGAFNLIASNTDGDASTHSREYLFINNVDYTSTPDTDIATNGGHIFKQMYFFWPVLAEGGTWDAANLPTSTLNIIVSEVDILNADTDVVADPYNDFDGTNDFNTFGVDVHPDHHGIVAIKEDDAAKTYRILLTTDGGPFISKTSTNPGVTEGDWKMAGNTYNTGQFYGADKKPGEDAYFGGLQDNGTWQSPVNADATTNYSFKIGGDGFEVLWHSQDPNKLIGGWQGNKFERSTNGGTTFSPSTSGLSGEHPFISKLSTSKKLPDVIYTVSSAGVFKSENFGQNWSLTSITNQWGGASTFLDVEVSRANPDIIWAGSGISSESDRRIFVSADQGKTFSPSEFTELASGTITRLASHPSEPNTAYVIFSQAQRPKILRTEDLGKTWTDITGFGNNITSNNGFPDVAVYCLYVHFDDPNKMWAGTDIGIVESLDNGVSWNLLNSDMPKVAVWDMKGQDNQIVIATHGRGIWTATVDNSQTAFEEGPYIIASGTSPQNELVLLINAAKTYDSTEVYVNSQLAKTQFLISVGEVQISISDVVGGNKEVKFISYKNGVPVFTASQTLPHLILSQEVEELTDGLKLPGNFFLDGLQINSFLNTGNSALQSPHNYKSDAELTAVLLSPIIVSGTNSTFNYEDIAIIEPAGAGAVFGDAAFNDYVVVEATKDGLNWTPIEDGYNASADTGWLAGYNGSVEIDNALYVNHVIDLTNTFSVGDTLLFRFRMFSNAQNVGWGWSVDNIYIQTEPLGIEKAAEVSSYSVYPVPSKGSFTLDYQLTSGSDVVLEITNAIGKRLKMYDLGTKSAGNYRFKFEDYNLENGVYIFSLKTNTGISSQRVLISK